MLKNIEKTILARLKEVFTDYEVDGFPVYFTLYTFTSPKGCILLRYEGSTMSNQNDMWAVMTEEEYNFTVFAGLRYAQKHSDVYPFLRQLKTVLNGFSIMTKKLEVIKINFEDEINGDLWYSYELRITLPLTDEYPNLSGAGETIDLSETANS